jgi:hypothetical protein
VAVPSTSYAPVRRKEIVYLRTLSERKHRSKEETLTARLERWIQRTRCRLFSIKDSKFIES